MYGRFPIQPNFEIRLTIYHPFHGISLHAELARAYDRWRRKRLSWMTVHRVFKRCRISRDSWRFGTHPFMFHAQEAAQESAPCRGGTLHAVPVPPPCLTRWAAFTDPYTLA